VRAVAAARAAAPAQAAAAARLASRLAAGRTLAVALPGAPLRAPRTQAVAPRAHTGPTRHAETSTPRSRPEPSADGLTLGRARPSPLVLPHSPPIQVWHLMRAPWPKRHGLFRTRPGAT
jgi:hypothetical protein